MNIKTCLVLFSAIVVGGCASGPLYQTLKVKDVVLQPAIRISRNVYSPNDTGAAPLGLQTGLAVELGAFHASGSESQSLNAGQVRIGERTFAAPETLKTEFDFTTYDVSARWRRFFEGEAIGYDLSGGLAYADLNLSVSSPTIKAAESVSSPALRVGVAGFWRMLSNTRVEATGTVLGTRSNLSGVARFDASLVRTWGRYATVQAGYSAWQLDAPGTTRSRLQLRFHGPSFGLGVNF